MSPWRQLLRCSAAPVLASTLSACSFLFTTKPKPRAPDSPPGPVECTSSRVAPAIDSSVVLGEAIFIAAALARDDGAYPNRTLYIAGSVGVAAVFLASALYGYDVTHKCQVLKGNPPNIKQPSSSGAFPAPNDEDGRRGLHPDPWASLVASGAEAPDVPKKVAGFSFSTTPAEAERICTATRRAWSSIGRMGSCVGTIEGSDATNARLEFELGTLSKIVILHQSEPDVFIKRYDSLHERLRVRYGKPQVARAPLNDDCATALEKCLTRGDTSPGSTWHLRSGRIELLSVWRDGHAFIEERYTREEPPPE